MDFSKALTNELENDCNVARTENGALAYRTTNKALLDMHYSLSSLRSKREEEIENMFAKAFYDDKILACRFMFYAGAIRVSGAGERRVFKTCLKWLSRNEPEICKAIIPLVPEFTRWDNLWVLLDGKLKNDVIKLVKKQLAEDVKNCTEGKNCSLASKWMPSCNSSSNETKRLAKIFIKELGMTERTYRKTLSKLRKYLDVVEVKMSGNEWYKINYSTVPSKANLLYNKAFFKHDEERRTAYLEKLKSGDKSVKINAGTLFPHDIALKYMSESSFWDSKLKLYDETLEQLWKNLNDTVGGADNILVVADSSRSMYQHIDPNNSRLMASNVCDALAIYFAERCSGIYKDKFITFSSHPGWVNLSGCKSFHDKLAKVKSYYIVERTNIEKTFDLILDAAIHSGAKQEDLPSAVLILSDMEFDMGTYGRPDQKLFDTIKGKFEAAGYTLPKLVFWNIANRSGAIPVKANGNGFPCALVSGFSTGVVKMVLSGQTDPWLCFLDIILSKDFDVVEEAVKNLV